MVTFNFLNPSEVTSYDFAVSGVQSHFTPTEVTTHWRTSHREGLTTRQAWGQLTLLYRAVETLWIKP